MTRHPSLSVLLALAGLALAAAAASTPTLAQAVVALPTGASTGPGGHAVVPVTVTPADGVLSLDFAVQYDPALVGVATVLRTPLTSGMTLAWNVPIPGQLRLSLYGATPLLGSGDVVDIYFQGLGAAPGVSPLHWLQHDLNEGQIPSTAVDGSVALTAGAAFLRVPDDANGAPGTRVYVPIVGDPATGFLGVDAQLRYDPALLQALAVRTTPFTAGWTVFANLATPGMATLALFGTTAPVGTGPIAEVEFLVVGSLGQATPLDLVAGTVNEGAIPVSLDDGLFTICADADEDGVTACGGDCDDARDDVHPGAPEVCDGRDNQCPGDAGYGSIDEGVTTTFYRDADGDGYGVTGDTVTGCAVPGGYAEDDGDCDDGDASVSPGAAEVCNAKDDDCDPASADGAAEPWVGSACDGADADLCAEGTYACTGGAQACSDTTATTDDVCDGADNDCDPATADGAAEPWVGSACDGADADLCAEGTYACTAGAQACTDASGDALDVCDGADNDCNPATADGAAEPWVGAACDGPDADLCAEGTYACTGGAQARRGPLRGGHVRLHGRRPGVLGHDRDDRRRVRRRGQRLRPGDGGRRGGAVGRVRVRRCRRGPLRGGHVRVHRGRAGLHGRERRRAGCLRRRGQRLQPGDGGRRGGAVGRRRVRRS